MVFVAIYTLVSYGGTKTFVKAAMTLLASKLLFMRIGGT